MPAISGISFYISDTKCSFLILVSLLQTEHIAPDLIQVLEVQLTHKEALPVTHLRYDVAPGIHDHRVSIRFLRLVVLADLGCRHDIALVFNGTGSEKTLPVVGTGLREELTRG